MHPWGLSLDLNLGTPTAFGDPTLLSSTVLTNLGITTTRSGSQLHYPQRQALAAGGFSEIGANQPVFTPVEIAGTYYSALLPQGAATGLVSYSNDLTNSAWTKTNCTATLELGGLKHDADWRGASYAGLGWEATDFDGSVGAVDGDTLSNTSIGASGTYPRFGKNIAAAAGKFILVYGRIDGDRSSVVLTRYISGGTTINGTYDSGTGEFTLPIFLVEGATPRLFINTNGTSLFEITVADLSIREVDAHTLLTATANNATVARTLTRSSANRNSLILADVPAGNAGDVLLSQGEGGGSPLYSDDFSSDTSGEWAYGVSRVDGTKSVSDGTLVYTIGASDTVFPRIYRPISGFTVGKRYKAVATVGGTAATKLLRFSVNTSGDSGNPEIQNGVVYFTAAATTLNAVLIANGTAGQTATLDDVSITEVSETTLPDNFNETELTAYTGANPQLAIRLTNSGDTCRVYNWNHQEPGAGVPVHRWLRPVAGTPETVGATSYVKTLGAAPTSIDVSILAVQTPMSVNSSTPNPGLIAFDDTTTNNRIDLLWLNFTGADQLSITHRKAGVEVSTNNIGSLTYGQLFTVDLQASAATFRARVNGGAWTTGSGEAIATMTRLRIGARLLDTTPWQSPIIAFRDNNGQLGIEKNGFNHSAIDKFIANGYSA